MFLRIRLPILAISVSRATFLAAHKSIEGLYELLEASHAP